MMKNIMIFISIVFLFSSCEYSEKITPSGNVIKVGILAPLSGKSKRLGHQSVLGIKAAKEIHKYLQNTDEIVFTIVDTKSDLQSTKKAFLELVKKDVKVIISFMGSTEMIAMKNIFHNTKIPIITTLATDDNLVKKDGYITQVCIDNNTQVLVASHYIKDERFIENIGVIYDKENEYSISLANEFRSYYNTLGGKIDFYIDISDSTGLKEFEKIKKKNIKMLFNTTNSILTTKVLKIINTQKYDFEILATDGLLSGALELKKEDLSLFDGVYVVEHYAHDTRTNKERKRLEKLLDKDGFKESSYAFLAYDGYKLLKYSLENCPQYNNKCINSLLHNSDVIKGVSSNFSMVDAKAKREVFVGKIKDSTLYKEVVVY